MSGNDVVYELKTPSSGVTTRTRYLPLNGQYLAKVSKEGTNPEYKYFYHTDLVGSVRAITDIWGQTVAKYDYEPFGVPFQSSGWMTTDTQRFTGKRSDASTGLYYYNARYMDPKVGRFISADTWTDLPDDERGPILGGNPAGYNRYPYVLNNPVMYTDPTGHKLAVGSTIENEDDTLAGQHVWTGDADYDDTHASKGYERDQREAYAKGRTFDIWRSRQRAAYFRNMQGLSAGSIGGQIMAGLVGIATDGAAAPHAFAVVDGTVVGIGTNLINTARNRWVISSSEARAASVELYGLTLAGRIPGMIGKIRSSLGVASSIKGVLAYQDPERRK